MNKFMKILLLIVIITIMFMVFSINACADSDELTIQINVYQGDTFIGATTMQAYPGEDLCLTSLNELYGDPQSANVTINGVAGMALTWSFPDYLTYATSSFGWAEAGDEVVINLYYPAVETDPEPEEITYGTLMLDLAVNDNDTPTNYSIFLKGIKGVDTIEGTYAFPEDGILTLTNLDVSYAWEYTFNDSTWPVDFDENNTYYNQLSVQTAPEPGPITEGNEHMVYITWEYCQEAGGNMVDGHADNAFVAGTTSFLAVSGVELDLNDLYQNPPGATYAGDNLVQVGNNFYRMSSVYRSGNNVQAGGELENFIMIDDDLDVTFTYIFDHSVETEIEKEVIVEKEVEKEVIVEKEVPVEVPVEMPVEVIKEVEKEIPVPVLTPVEIPVPVPIPVTVEKETIKEVPIVVEKEKETIKEVPRIVTNTIERPVIVEKETTKIVEKPVVAETTNTTTTTNNITTPANTNGLEEIDEGAVPLAEFIPSFNEEPENVNTWSLINLGLLILTFLLWFSYEPLGPGNIITGIAMLANIILYMQTQDLAGKVIWIDKWTWIMALIYAIGLGVKYYQYNKENKKTS